MLWKTKVRLHQSQLTLTIS